MGREPEKPGASGSEDEVDDTEDDEVEDTAQAGQPVGVSRASCPAGCLLANPSAVVVEHQLWCQQFGRRGASHCGRDLSTQA